MGLGFLEGLGGFREGVGDGLVPVHVLAAGALFPRTLFAQGCLHGGGDQLGSPRRVDHVGFGCAEDDCGSFRLCGGKRARDHVEGDAQPEAVTAPLEAADGVAGEFERGGPVVEEERYSGRPDQVGSALIAERHAELAAFAQACAGLFGVSLDDGRAYLQ